jgi:hypothetical protein
VSGFETSETSTSCFVQCLLLVALVAGSVTAAPGIVAAAPVAAYAAAPVAYAPAPAVVTAHSSQVFAQRFNALAAPLVAAAYTGPAYAAYAPAPILLK